MATVGYTRSIPEVFSEVVEQFTTLLRKETRLARVELQEKIGEAASGLGFAVGGAVLLIPALVILFEAAVAGILALGLHRGWAALIVGGVAFLIGIALLAGGLARLRAARPIPSRTIEQLQRDVAVAKQQVEMGVGDGTRE